MYGTLDLILVLSLVNVAFDLLLVLSLVNLGPVISVVYGEL